MDPLLVGRRPRPQGGRQRLMRSRNLLDLSAPMGDGPGHNREHETSPSIEEVEEPSEEEDEDPLQGQEGEGYREEVHPKAQDDNNNNNNNCEMENKLDMLRQLLAIERQRNEQRRHNNQSMQQYCQQLQHDYLKLQRDLLEALELGHKIKCQKEAQIEALEVTIKERDKLVEQLKLQVESLDCRKVKEEFQELLRRQRELAQLEQEQVREQMQVLEQQLVSERVNSSQLLQQFQSRLDEEVKKHDKELATLRHQLEARETELKAALEEPKNRVLRELREHKTQLECQVEELGEAVEGSRTKYEAFRKRLETLQEEQTVMVGEQREQATRWEEEQAELKRNYSELKLKLDEKDELVQILQFNLQRSEKRAKNLLGALKGKEQAYKDIIAHMELKYQKEVEELRSRSLGAERRLVECKDELDQKQIELMRVQLERENQLDSLRTDRDQRLQKLNQERQKLEKQMQTLEVRLAKEVEQGESRAKQMEELYKDVDHFRSESKRLSIEVTKMEAKLYSQQQELSQALKERELYQMEADQNQGLVFELEDSKRLAKRWEDMVEQLRRENEKLAMKLKVNESSLGQIGQAIKKEQAKMVLEYEKKLESIRVEQSVYDKNKLKYKRYGYKLKKYCEHLNQVHQHICNPEVCGYTIVIGK